MVDCLSRALDGKLPAMVCLRVNPGGNFTASNGIIGEPEDSKFGMTVDQVMEAARRLSAMGVTEFGLHAFLASNTQVEDYYPRLARVLFELAVRLSRELDVHVRLVDLSGGIGIDYRPEDVPVDIAAVGEGVRRVYEEVLVPAGMGDVALAAELGRWMLAPAGGLVIFCRVPWQQFSRSPRDSLPAHLCRFWYGPHMHCHPCDAIHGRSPTTTTWASTPAPPTSCARRSTAPTTTSP